jgi:integrase
VTRNCRLAAIRSFAEHLLRHDFTRAEQYRRILAIPAKRARTRVVAYLEPEDVRAVIAAVVGTDLADRRDRAMLLLLYNAGARINEALAIRAHDLQLDRTPLIDPSAPQPKLSACSIATTDAPFGNRARLGLPTAVFWIGDSKASSCGRGSLGPPGARITRSAGSVPTGTCSAWPRDR